MIDKDRLRVGFAQPGEGKPQVDLVATYNHLTRGHGSQSQTLLESAQG